MQKNIKKTESSFYNGSNNYFPKNISKMCFHDGTDEYWNNFREENKKVLEKSQDDFEKYLNIFGSGGLLVGLTLLSKLTDAKISYSLQWLLIVATILFVLCLLSNLLSHHIAVSNNNKNINDIDCQNPTLWDNFSKRNKILGYFNIVSLSSIVLGTLLITFFLIFNINTMAKQSSNPPNKPSTPKVQPTRESGNKGRTTTQPPSQKPPQKK